MSSNHTPNYGLSQWERTDKVLMDDFNADNAKIDAAFLNHPSAELIASVTVEEESGWLELDISGVDWSRYMMAVLTYNSETDGHISVIIGNNNRCQYLASSVGNSTSNLLLLDKVNHMTALFPVFYSGGRRPTAIGFGSGSSSTYCCLTAGGSQTPISQCDAVHITRSIDGIRPGDQAELWGVK